MRKPELKAASRVVLADAAMGAIVGERLAGARDGRAGVELGAQQLGVHPGHTGDQAGVDGVRAQVGGVHRRHAVDGATDGVPLAFAGRGGRHERHDGRGRGQVGGTAGDGSASWATSTRSASGWHRRLACRPWGARATCTRCPRPTSRCRRRRGRGPTRSAGCRAWARGRGWWPPGPSTPTAGTGGPGARRRSSSSDGDRRAWAARGCAACAGPGARAGSAWTPRGRAGGRPTGVAAAWTRPPGVRRHRRSDRPGRRQWGRARCFGDLVPRRGWGGRGTVVVRQRAGAQFP